MGNVDPNDGILEFAISKEIEFLRKKKFRKEERIKQRHPGLEQNLQSSKR